LDGHSHAASTQSLRSDAVQQQTYQRTSGGLSGVCSSCPGYSALEVTAEDLYERGSSGTEDGAPDGVFGFDNSDPNEGGVKHTTIAVSVVRQALGLALEVLAVVVAEDEPRRSGRPLR
jgi:hypothetical protein